MRWRLIDRITAFTPQRQITGVATVSLDAYLLPEVLGRDGEWPETLVLAACCELAHWATAAASEWRAGTDLEAVEDFAFAHPARAGEVLTITMTWENMDILACVVGDRGCRAAGRLRFTTASLLRRIDPLIAAEDWEVLRGTAR